MLPKVKNDRKTTYDSHTTPRQFVEGDPVWARNFHQGPRWCRATVAKCLGNGMYKVKLEEQTNVIW